MELTQPQNAQQPQATPPAAETRAQPTDEARLAVIARKEKELREKEAKLKDSVSLSELQRLAKENRSEFEKRLGLSLQELTAQPEPKEEDPITTLRQEIEGLRQKEAQREIERYKSDIRSQLEANREQFELVNSLGGADDVYELIEAHYAEHGEILDVKDAAEKLENYLLEQAKKLVAAQKIKGLLTPESAAKEQPKADEKKPAPTLSPSLSAPASAPRTFDSRMVEESKKRAAALIKWD